MRRTPYEKSFFNTLLELSPAPEAVKPPHIPDVVERLTAVEKLGVSGGIDFHLSVQVRRLVHDDTSIHGLVAAAAIPEPHVLPGDEDEPLPAKVARERHVPILHDQDPRPGGGPARAQGIERLSRVAAPLHADDLRVRAGPPAGRGVPVRRARV